MSPISIVVAAQRLIYICKCGGSSSESCWIVTQTSRSQQRPSKIRNHRIGVVYGPSSGLKNASKDHQRPWKRLMNQGTSTSPVRFHGLQRARLDVLSRWTLCKVLPFSTVGGVVIIPRGRANVRPTRDQRGRSLRSELGIYAGSDVVVGSRRRPSPIIIRLLGYDLIEGGALSEVCPTPGAPNGCFPPHIVLGTTGLSRVSAGTAVRTVPHQAKPLPPSVFPSYRYYSTSTQWGKSCPPTGKRIRNIV